ncbi:endonuclease 8-like 1 isoform X8 [Choloepus didactylus]|uniref:endonuclease 8-like 1 isoform X8 n=1 Tax=Choloepus didactylus TaxID=27675 RepID=UPI0018A027DF|nr:endonuclease 8-like 1 isoform X8 [Choloepus didactylus]
MPEGPELHLASQFVNETCGGLVFGGCVEKSAVSRNPEVPFESSAYRISAAARGKELRLTLSPLPGAQPQQEPLALVFRFGMSGSFQVAPSDALPPHAHLRFYTAAPSPQLTLCFVDIRRFGRWDLGGEWQPGRGPCVLLEYEQFRENVLRNLADKAFDRPICEALLDQRFFNGIGNYLRAEILHRLRIPPFEKARTVLEAVQHRRLGDPGPLAPKGGKSRKKKSKETQAGPEDQAEGPPTPSKAPPRTRRARRELPKQTAAWEPGGANFQRDPEAPIVPEERKRRARPAASGRLPSASSLPATGSPAEEGGGHAGGRSMGKKVGGRLWGSPRPVGPLVRSLS